MNQKQPKKTAYLQLHRICDQDCIFCAQPTNGNYLNFSEIQDQIDYYISENYTDIIFSGGEPTMSPYFFQTLEYCFRKSIQMRILTNGHMFAKKEFAEKSIQSGLKEYHISLHSHIQQVHDAMVKKEGSYIRSLEAMRNIIQFGGELNINITINNYNVRYFQKSILFFLKTFPQLKGFIINNLETSQISSKYYSVIAPLRKIKDIIQPSLEIILNHNKKVRVERVPMCYLRGYEHLSTDVEYTVIGESKYLHYLDSDTVSGELNKDTVSADYTYGKYCQNCDLKGICAGLDGIRKHYSEDDLIPQKLSGKELQDLLHSINQFLG